MTRPISIPPPVPKGSASGNPRLIVAASLPYAASAASDLARDDWDLLFRAVMGRLSRIAAEPGGDNPTAQPLPESARQLRIEVRECVNALRQLHAWKLDPSGRDLRFQQAYRDLRWSLAWPRVDTEAISVAVSQAD